MAGEQPALVVRVAANLDQLKTGMQETQKEVAQTTATIQDLTKSFTVEPMVQASGQAATAVAAIGTSATTTAANTEALTTATTTMAGSQDKATTTSQQLKTSFGQFDSMLSSVGINVGQQTKAIEELAGSVGKSVGQVGALATAGSALAVGMGAWQITRAAMQFFDLDKKVEGAWRSLLHYGDVAAEVAGAKQDTINRAIAQGAEKTITYANAVKFLNEKHDAAGEAAKNYEIGIKELTLVGQNWHEVLKTIDPIVAQQAKHYLELGASTKAVGDSFKLSEAQVRALTSSIEADTKATKDLEAAQKDVAKVEGEVRSIRAASVEDLAGIGVKVKQEYFDNMSKGVDDIKKAQQELGDFMAKQTLSTTEYQKMKINEVADADIAAFKGTADQAAQYQQLRLALAEEQKNALIAKEQETQAGIQEAIAIGHGPEELLPWSTLGKRPIGGSSPGGTISLGLTDVGDINAALKAFYDSFIGNSAGTPGVGSYGTPAGPAGWNMPRFMAEGGPVTPGRPYVVGERGPELFVPRASGTVMPTGGGGTVNHFYITQPLGTPQAIAAAVGTAQMTAAKGRGERFRPIGV
jgi:hypothetical protein